MVHFERLNVTLHDGDTGLNGFSDCTIFQTAAWLRFGPSQSPLPTTPSFA